MRPDYQPEMESRPINIRLVPFYDTVVLEDRRFSILTEERPILFSPIERRARTISFTVASCLRRQPVAGECKSQSDFWQKLAAQEKEMIEAALSETGGQVFGPSGAAEKLEIHRTT
jgi:transcriptional regulator with PAS, ATPase and Fis domain